MAEDRTPRFVGRAERIDESMGARPNGPASPDQPEPERHGIPEASAVDAKLSALDEVRRDLQQPHVC